MIGKNGLLPLFLSQSFRSVAVSLLSFFSSVFIFKRALALGASTKEAFLFIFTSYFLLYIGKILGTSGAENLSLRYGLKKQVLIGLLLTGLTSLAFIYSRLNFSFIWIATFLWGLAIGFFWFGRHGLVTKISSSESFGRAEGWSGILESGLLSCTPFLGGVIIAGLGYPALFLVAFAFVLLGILVLIPVEEQKTHRDVTLKEIFRLMMSHKKVTLAYLSTGAGATLYSDAFVLFVFLSVKKEIAFGEFFSLSMLLVALINFLIGNWVDKKGKRSLIAVGAVFSSLIWMGRFITNAIGALLIFDVIDRVVGSMLTIPLQVLSWQKAVDGNSTGRALVFRELAITSGSILSCLFLIALVFFGLDIRISFLAGAALSLFPLFIINRSGVDGEP